MMAARMYSLLFSALSPAGNHARLPILTFHRVTAEDDWLFPGEATAARFERLCGWLRAWFRVLPLDQALQLLFEGRLPSRACAITFDDGYADNHDVALPILQHAGLPATFFISTGFSGGECMWNDVIVDAVRRTTVSHIDAGDIVGSELGRLPLGSREERRRTCHALLARLKYLPDDHRQHAVRRCSAALAVEPCRNLMMSDDQLRAMSRAGMLLGAHTVSHPILKGLDDERVGDELQRSRAKLEDLIQRRVGLFAYPNGRPGVDFDEHTVCVVRDLGFDAALTTAQGAASRDCDPHQVPRIMPWAPDRWRFLLQLSTALRRSPEAALGSGAPPATQLH